MTRQTLPSSLVSTPIITETKNTHEKRANAACINTILSYASANAERVIGRLQNARGLRARQNHLYSVEEYPTEHTLGVHRLDTVPRIIAHLACRCALLINSSASQPKQRSEQPTRLHQALSVVGISALSDSQSVGWPGGGEEKTVAAKTAALFSLASLQSNSLSAPDSNPS